MHCQLLVEFDSSGVRVKTIEDLDASPSQSATFSSTGGKRNSVPANDNDNRANSQVLLINFSKYIPVY